MALLKCKMCGGELSVSDGSTVCVCEYCGTKQTVPSLDNEKKINLFTRANRLRFNCEFDKAYSIYETILIDYPEEAEAYWGLVLCKYGIEYVDDPATVKKVPTCHRSSFDSVFDDSNFEMAIEYADICARMVYREEAKVIEEIRKGIIEISSREEPYDIFICYKETDENGSRTVDSLIAEDVYDALTEKGYRVFFARITLEDKLGKEYEPYIFSALHSSKIMLVFGTDYEYFNAVWVKNEWSRFLKLIENDKEKTLIPCYKDIDAYDMPKEFKKLQAQDMGKVGAVKDLLRGISKIISEGKSESIEEKVVVHSSPQNSSLIPMLKRAQILLDEGAYEAARQAYQKILDIDANNEYAFIGLFFAENKTNSFEELANKTAFFNHTISYKNLLTVCSEETKARLDKAQERIENNIYNKIDKCLKEKNFSQAKNYANIVLEQKPNNKKAIIALFLVENGVSSFEELDKSLSFFIGKDSYKNLTKIGDNQISEILLSKHKKIIENNFVIIEKHISAGEFKQAKQYLRQVLAVEPENEEALFSLLLVECSCSNVNGLSLAKKPISKAPSYAMCMTIPTIKEKIIAAEHEQEKVLAKRKKGKIAITISSISALIVICLISLAIFSVYASTDVYKYRARFSDGDVIITGYRGIKSDVVIPSEIAGKPVTTIGNYSFDDERIRSITIPDGVKYIGKHAFDDCRYLESIILPESVTYIGEYAFNECENLKSIVIPSGVTRIENNTFYRCHYLESIEIPSNVKYIGSSAFEVCDGLTSIVIPDSVTSIGSFAFAHCDSLTSIVIPNSVTSIGVYAFAHCDNLTSLIIPDSVTSIGNYAFEDCTNLTIYCEAKSKPSGWGYDWNGYKFDNIVWGIKEFGTYEDLDYIAYSDGSCKIICYSGNATKVTIPSRIGIYDVKEIGEYAFLGCNSLEKVVIANSVTKIGEGAFWSCKSLKSVDMSTNVREIYRAAFALCTSLETIIIPYSTVYIEELAFDGCTNLTIYCEDHYKPSGWVSNWNSSNCTVVWNYKGK